MNQLLKGEPMTIFGDGEQERAFTHINDVAPVIANCVDIQAARNEVFNVGADVPFTVNQPTYQALGSRNGGESLSDF